jgi:deazaflavin-dependent oxidoreductase (nitroreductase family)
MAGSQVTDKPPGGLMLFLLRFPLIFYRLGLGGLLGQRFICLNHVGRKSGRLHQTVVEVVGHDADTGAYFIVSGWGYKAQWYQNLHAQPDVDVQLGWRRLHVHAETLTPQAGARILLAYQQRHPTAARELGRIMGIDLGSAGEAALQDIVQERLPVLGLYPAAGR